MVADAKGVEHVELTTMRDGIFNLDGVAFVLASLAQEFLGDIAEEKREPLRLELVSKIVALSMKGALGDGGITHQSGTSRVLEQLEPRNAPGDGEVPH